MTENNQDTESEFPPLPCSKIVYRALNKKSWINGDTGQILPSAFELRKHRQEIGISVNTISPQDCVSKFNRCRFVASLHVGTVRDLGLDIIQDKHNHADIIGLPYQEDNVAESERLRGLLANKSRIIEVERS